MLKFKFKQTSTTWLGVTDALAVTERVSAVSAVGLYETFDLLLGGGDMTTMNTLLILHKMFENRKVALGSEVALQLVLTATHSSGGKTLLAHDLGEHLQRSFARAECSVLVRGNFMTRAEYPHV